MRRSLGTSFAAFSMVAFGLLAVPAQAGLLVEDPFNIGPGNDEYTDGSALSGQPGDGTKPLGWGGNWSGSTATSVQGGLEYTGIPSNPIGGTGTGEGHYTSNSGGPEREIAAGSQSGSETELWLRYLWNPRDLVDGSTVSDDVEIMSFRQTVGDSAGSVTLKRDNSNNPVPESTPGNRDGLEVTSIGGTTQREFFSTRDGSTHLILMRLDINRSGDDTVDLFIDWASTSEPTSGDAIASLTANVLDSGDTLREYFTFSRADYQVDEMALGESFSSVAIPEPASLALLAPVGLLALRRRRR